MLPIGEDDLEHDRIAGVDRCFGVLSHNASLTRSVLTPGSVNLQSQKTALPRAFCPLNYI
jgi:hypothetical protein